MDWSVSLRISVSYFVAVVDSIGMFVDSPKHPALMAIGWNKSDLILSVE
jgi:hypothetical protein